MQNFQGHKISLPEYTPREFVARVRQTQALLKQSSVDCLLIINGADGNNNKVSNTFVDWLLNGSSANETLMNYHIGQKFEESFLILTQSELRCFISDTLFAEYQHFFHAFPLKDMIIIPSEMLEKSRAEFELRKSAEFIRMITDCQNVGVVLTPERGLEPNVKQIEQWPLIQIFAVNGELIRYRRRILLFEKECQGHHRADQQSLLQLRLQIPRNSNLQLCAAD